MFGLTYPSEDPQPQWLPESFIFSDLLDLDCKNHEMAARRDKRAGQEIEWPDLADLFSLKAKKEKRKEAASSQQSTEKPPGTTSGPAGGLSFHLCFSFTVVPVLKHDSRDTETGCCCLEVTKIFPVQTM